MLAEMDEEFGVGALVEGEFKEMKASVKISSFNVYYRPYEEPEFDEFGIVRLVVFNVYYRPYEEPEFDEFGIVRLVVFNVYYRPYEEPEFDEFGIVKKKSILSKYDEELEGPKKELFKIGCTSTGDREKELELIRLKLKQQQGTSLDLPALKLASEYYTDEEMVRFRKSKRK
ncbi:uncharacterized protein LOC143242351 [Tachypleus tridentatus]|uniref:uncharacterized protein LOC143242351 n=1 Tax=Tachypleus tridentatus TaxID=6853 RepID=UPI003FD570DD